MPTPSSSVPKLAVAALATLFLVAAADAPAEKVVRDRFVKIVAQMEKLRFCQSGRCRYREVRWQVKKSNAPGKPYEGLIRSDIIRPSGAIDHGRYVFAFQGGRWQLLTGSETTDVNDASYTGAHYEFSSAYGRTPVSGTLTDPNNDLETGYKQLYLKILDQGRER